MATPAAQNVIKKTVFTEVIPSDSPENKTRRKRPPIWEFLPTIPAQEWKDLRYEIRLYRYNPQTEKRMAVEKIYELIDPFWVQKKYGGGAFNVLVSEDSQLIYNEDFNIEGEPKIAGSIGTIGNGAGASGSDSVALQALHMASNPEMIRLMMEMMRTAAIQSMEIMKAQIPVQQNPLETLRTAKEILGVGSNDSSSIMDTIRVLKELGIIGSPEKKGINEVLEMITTLKGAGLVGGAATKPDLTSTLVANLPMLADRVVSGLHEFRLQAETNERIVRLQRGEIRPDDANVITMDGKDEQRMHHPASNATPAATPMPASSIPAQAISPEVAQQVIMQADLQRLVDAMKQPDCTGEDVYTFLSCVWPGMLEEMSKFSKENLLLFFRSREMQNAKLGNAILFEVADDPRLPRMIEEFLKFAKENAPLTPSSEPPSGPPTPAATV